MINTKNIKQKLWLFKAALGVFVFNSSLSFGSWTAANVRTESEQVLIYGGTATAYGDTEALGEILDEHQVSYKVVSSEDLNAMSLDELSGYKAVVWPGGYAGYMSESLETETRERLREAVVDRGVSFVGICAGAFIAVSPAAKKGEAGPAWGLSILPGKIMPYYHLEDEDIDSSMVQLNFAEPFGKLVGGISRSLVWWGGPILPEIPNGVIARYSDTQEPAIIQTQAGKGLVYLSAPHPEAPEEWRTKLDLEDPDGLDQDIAWQLIEAALKHILLPT